MPFRLKCTVGLADNFVPYFWFCRQACNCPRSHPSDLSTFAALSRGARLMPSCDRLWSRRFRGKETQAYLLLLPRNTVLLVHKVVHCVHTCCLKEQALYAAFLLILENVFFYFAFASPAAAEDSLAVFCNLASQAYTGALRKTNAHQAFSACSSLSFELHSWPFYFTLRCSLINVSVVNENDIAGIWTTWMWGTVFDLTELFD